MHKSYIQVDEIDNYIAPNNYHAIENIDICITLEFSSMSLYSYFAQPCPPSGSNFLISTTNS